jgi:tetratricopeptide (TPR) repeat protein
MSTPHESVEDRLITRLLRHLDADLEAAPHGAHPDAEILGLFALGQLDPEERNEVIRHLAECVGCRQAVSMLLMSLDRSAVPEARRALPFRPRRRWLLASVSAAAVLLLATALSLLRHAPAEAQVYARAEALLYQSDFPAARALLRDADRKGVRSDRLRNLHAQAERELRGPMALALAGRLSDFGFDLDGVAARAVKEPVQQPQLRRAYELLAECGSDEDAVVLNRGHALLTLGERAPALAEFEAVAARSPREPLAWLGVGLAQYLLQNYAAAERAFGTCLDLDANNISARINLAMTLEERGQPARARAEWQRVLAGPLSPEDRAKIERAVSELRP